jgi:uncharacterized protein (DUF4213/DUF364 family)
VQAQNDSGLAAATQLEGAVSTKPLIGVRGGMTGRLGSELARLALSDSPWERSIGFATLNALLDVPFGACVEENAAELILQKGSEKRVAVVGHFPFVGEVRKFAKVCWVLELDPGPEDEPASRASELIPQADVVAITGMTLLNRTFEALISFCRPDAYVLLLGPSTPLAPILFDCGVDALSGAIVIDIPAVVLGVSQGATFRQLVGRRLVTMEATRWRLLQGQYVGPKQAADRMDRWSGASISTFRLLAPP